MSAGIWLPDSSGIIRRAKKVPIADLSGIQRNTKTGWLGCADGVTRKIFSAAFCSAEFISTDYWGSTPIDFTDGSFDHNSGAITCNFNPSHIWQVAIFRLTFDDDIQHVTGDNLFVVTPTFEGIEGNVKVAVFSASGSLVVAGNQVAIIGSGTTVSQVGTGNFVFRSMEMTFAFRENVTHANIPAGALSINNKLITGYHD